MRGSLQRKQGLQFHHLMSLDTPSSHWYAKKVFLIFFLLVFQLGERLWAHWEHILLYWPFEFRKVGKLHLTSIVAYILPMHSFLFMHWRRLKSCTPAKKPLCDWSIRCARLSLVEGSAFPGCLANVAACLNSCFMHTNFHTNLRKTSPPHHYIIITPTWYQPFEATISTSQIFSQFSTWWSFYLLTGPQDFSCPVN